MCGDLVIPGWFRGLPPLDRVRCLEGIVAFSVGRGALRPCPPGVSKKSADRALITGRRSNWTSAISTWAPSTSSEIVTRSVNLGKICTAFSDHRVGVFHPGDLHPPILRCSGVIGL